MLILEYWLGKKSKSEVAKELGVSPLRVWQLSQKALSGMLAGLLVQPRRRVGPEAFERTGSESPAQLKRQLVALEKELERTEDLVRVLRSAPWLQPGAESPPKGGKSRVKKPKRKGRKKSPARRASADRPMAPAEAPLEGGSGCDG